MPARRPSGAPRIILLAALTVTALASAALAHSAPARIFDTENITPIESSAHTVPHIVRDLAARRAASARQGPGAPDAPRDVGATLDEAEAGSAYDWGILQTWLPDDNGVQWCVDGYQSVQPLGGVKLYVLPQAYDRLASLQPESLVVTLDAEEQIPQRGSGRVRGPAMAHQFTYATCVLPEFTRVGTYSTVVYTCGSRRECAAQPHVWPTVLSLKPFLSTFDVCIDREAGEVEVFLSALYLDQRPDVATFDLQLGGSPVPDAQVQSQWPWVLVDFTLPLADYDSRFGDAGDYANVALASASPYTPRARLFFTKSDWLSPCIR